MRLGNLTKVAFLTLGFGLCQTLHGVSYTWEFTGTANQGSVGNSLYFTPSTGGPSIKASAWYLDASGTFQQAALGIFANGLGVCYPGENCTNPNNQVDNSVFREFILLESSRRIDPLSVRIKTMGDGGGSPSDTDITYWLGGGNGQSLSLTGGTIAGLAALGFGSRTNNNTGQDLCNGCTREVSLTPTGVGFTKLLFGAAYSGGADDNFAVYSMVANSVPEPSSIVLLGAVGLLSIHLVRRRAGQRPQAGRSRN